MKLIFDMASVIQTGLRKGSDGAAYAVQHEGKTVNINTADHGYENAVGYMVWCIEHFRVSPSDIIMVFEGKDSKKRRLQIASTYKGDREKSAPEYYTEYNRCKLMVKEVFRKLGATTVTQDYAEGDDTLKYLSQILDEEVIVISNDGDMAVLTGENPHGKMVSVMAGSEMGKLPEYVQEPRHLTLYKALVGDTNDGVKGVPQFGGAAWRDLVFKYGLDGIDEISLAISKNDSNTIAQFARQNNCKLLNKIVDNWNQVRICWRLVSIYSEWVNTRYNPLKWEAGVVLAECTDKRLFKYRQVSRLVTSETYDEALAYLKARLALDPSQVVAFDIETSSPEESDDWMEAQGKSDGVDPPASYICGFSITFGKGGNRTYYVPVKHYDTKNVTMKQARLMIEALKTHKKAIHNTAFELVVLYNDQAKDEDGTLWRDAWKDDGEFGMLPNIEDTLFMASYVDENAMSKGLKNLSKNVLGYQQTDFNTMRTLRMNEDGTKPFPGGRVFTRVQKTLGYEADGVTPILDAKGKHKEVTVTREVPGANADGTPMLKSVMVANEEGKRVKVEVPKMVKVPVTYEEVRYKMHELPATKVFDYGCDDTICTLAYYNFAKLNMQVDEHFHVYRKVEIDAAYLHAKNFYDGFSFAIHEMVKQKNLDAILKTEQEKILHEYLTGKGWAGTAQPSYTAGITPSEVKEAYGIVMGLGDAEEDEEGEAVEEGADPVMSMRIRTMSKIVTLIEGQDREGADMFAYRLGKLLEGDEQQFNSYIGEHFDGKPRFAYGNKDMCRLLYEVMGAEVKVRNKVTPVMRQKGIRIGNPKADTLAIDYAVIEAKKKGATEQLAVLNSLKLITMVNTRNGLFYNPYPGFIHWKTGKIHSSHRQCHANTRRASAASPNTQQWPSKEKVAGYAAAFRRTVLPHKLGAVIVSMDFNAQELRVIADSSQDPAMLACYVGESLRDMHSITGAGIAYRKIPELMLPAMEALMEKYPDEGDRRYFAFKSLSASHPEAYKTYRGLGKGCNFAAAYGAMAPKLAQTLMVSEEEAQMFLDAREEAFHVSSTWKNDIIIQEAKANGYVRTRLGAKRHLAEMLDSGDRAISSKAERQAANFVIQSSSAEMTKLAEGRMWRAGLFDKYDIRVIGPIHDEVVVSVAMEDLEKFLPEMHACMVQKYADMTVPILSTIDIGPNFFDMASWEDKIPSRAEVEEALSELAA